MKFLSGDIVKLKSLREVTDIYCDICQADEIKALEFVNSIFRELGGRRLKVIGYIDENVIKVCDMRSVYSISTDFVTLVKRGQTHIYIKSGELKGNILKISNIDDDGNYIWENKLVGTIKFTPKEIELISNIED